ncbi:FecR domain-containing protein [Waterburya agarophytonicola K14]|uniref:FecR domain-containing protein n=1 Tax=Waterburya agarophytonicola KI4 TaxID=2874699 RepID=A0A964BQS0_9CYAN|nr:FecR family protein [Waterburya agarophytonicola]MCC0177735.1 FecR domain-containing protein [Waterburya agarophytonicola KI4]
MQQFFYGHSKIIASFFTKLVSSLAIASVSIHPASADSVVKEAEIYQIRNQVDVNYRNKPNWNRAEVGDKIIPRDSVRTGADSRADILFNEGTLVRTGAGTTFRFPPGKRRFELTSGAALIMIRPEQGQSTISTPQAKIVSQGTALFIQHNPGNNSSLIGVLTDSPAGLVKVSGVDGDVTIQLQAGQFVSIIQGVVGLVEHFVLPMFYETAELSAGLGETPEEIEAMLAKESPEVRATIRAVRAEAIKPLQNQIAWLEGFCKVDLETQNLSSLLQLLGMGVSDVKLNLQVSEADLSIIPFRSLTGATWLNQYCKTKSTQ